MPESSSAAPDSEAVVDRVVAHAKANAESFDEGLAAYLHCYYSHVDSEDLAARRPEDLFGMSADHHELGRVWENDTAVRAINPKAEVDGWDSPHSVVMVVTEDLPFLVDSITMELSRLGVGIHLVVHPVMLDLRDTTGHFVDPHLHPESDARLASLAAFEIDRQPGSAELAEIETNLARVLTDTRFAVQDWKLMRDGLREVSAGLDPVTVPLDERDIEETKRLLDWLADDHFIFLGYREYRLAHADGVEVLDPVEGSGLGILRTENSPSTGRPLSSMPPIVQRRIHEKRLLNLTKASSKSTVHRATYLDYVGVKTFDSEGEVMGERRFLGLFTSDVYTCSVLVVPKVQRMVREVLERADLPEDGHDAKRLLSVIESYPRDEILQMEADELFETSTAISCLQERRRVRVFARRELFGRFVTCLVFLPRDQYSTVTRSHIQDVLIDVFGGSLANWDARVSESILARLLILLRTDGDETGAIDARDIESRITTLIQDWDDDFDDQAIHEFGEGDGIRISNTYRDGFPSEYRGSFDPRTAVGDILQMEEMADDDDLAIKVYREPGRPSTEFNLKLYRRGGRISLTSVMPSLTNLGVTVVDERPYEVVPKDQSPVWIYDFSLHHFGSEMEFADVAKLVEEAFTSVWSGTVDDDGFNRLVLGAGVRPREVAVLRTLARYLHQVGFAYSRLFTEQTLEQHPKLSRCLVDLFLAKFDPDIEDDEREAATAGLDEKIVERMDRMASLDQDRVIRRIHNLIGAAIRTNYFQFDDSGQPRPYLAVKFDPSRISEMPDPRPMFEIYVYSPRFEGVHLRAGFVARGGLRWSDRTEDYRTEILGLAKAQMVKNSVIIPGGAKGGFVLKQSPAATDQAAIREEVVTCYKLFVSGLLDLTDNIVDDEIVSPARTVRYDGDDAYLVVAADKGTATFSDVANELAIERGFWLGDAFASGGSHGYDHKKMGITARGAWESVKRHFNGFRVHVETEDFTAVGIGDMSGDVFGNGMLRSRHTKLLAAFDHRHIFVDPDPEPERSFVERQRLFDLPRSTWDDYEKSLISAGGGVFPRALKSVEITPQMRSALRIEGESMTPDELIAGILKAPVDLLWNGGIGTYIKAVSEPNSSVGDKANDHIRVDGCDLRCKVIGEGGNLGVTQLGRIEFSHNGGRVYTDAIDNSAGVDCSDHEVNIKILLDQVVADGDMTVKQRNELLERMTDEVTDLVLADNYNQTRALSVARVESGSMIEVDSRYLEQLVADGLIDRELEYLPSAEELSERRLEGKGLTAPELSVLSAYTKNILSADLIESTTPDDPAFDRLLVDYFPSELREAFADRIHTHRLSREIVANRVANTVVDRAGVSMIYRLSNETSAPSHEIAEAYTAAWEIYGLEHFTEEINSLDDVIDVEKQLSIHLRTRQLAERATRKMLRNRPAPFSASDAIADLADPVMEAIGVLPEHLRGADKSAYNRRFKELVATGAPEAIASRAAALVPSIAALDVVLAASITGAPLETVSAVHFAIAHRLDLTRLRDRIFSLPRNSQWETMARLSLRGDLYNDHRSLTVQVLTGAEEGADPLNLVDRWVRANQGAVDRYHQTIDDLRTAHTDLTTVLVATREVGTLIDRTS